MSDNPKLVWEKVLDVFKKEVSHANFVALFKKTELESLSEGIATISTSSTMLADMLQKRFSVKIKEQISALTGKDTDVLFIVKPLFEKNITELTKNAPLFNETASPTPLSFGHLPRVRPDYTFQSFAVSEGNQLAFVSSQKVAESVGTAYNPFFLYGPVGVGKTHHMHAIANDVYRKSPDKKIIYITSEEFTNEVVEAIKTNETAKMKKRFRSVLLLLIDDIQFIEGKERVQEELFHTFNILIDQGSQIILSSDRPPQDIKKLEKRLSSRFSGGLTVDIQAPDFELKTAIVMIKAQKYTANVPIDVAKILAENANDTRTLEGLLLKLITLSTTRNTSITTELAREMLGNKEIERGHIHAEDVIRTVCEFYNVKPTQLRGPKRQAGLVRARQVAMFLLKNKLGLTLSEIGNLLGGRDHTTIIHGVEKIEQLVDNKAPVNEDIMGINKVLNV